MLKKPGGAGTRAVKIFGIPRVGDFGSVSGFYKHLCHPGARPTAEVFSNTFLVKGSAAGLYKADAAPASPLRRLM
jgi:hypothetical protein